jgi:DNA-binding CsgD family transcriptional regulator
MSKTAAIARPDSPARHVVTTLSADELLESLRELGAEVWDGADADLPDGERVVVTCAPARATVGARYARPSGRIPLAPAAPAERAELAERFGLSDRQVEVARLLAAGHSNAEIAARLGLSTFTARNHAARVLHKLGIRRRSGVGLAILTEHDEPPGERPAD